MTYNIHKGIGGVDRRYDLQRVAAAISHCGPDIVFLQEVDDGVPRSRSDRQAARLAEMLDYPHHAFQGNVFLRIGLYGNAILSRFPLSDVESLDLTVPLKKRRRALTARCRLTTEAGHRTMLLINLHLGLAGFERRLQLRRLLNWGALQRVHRDTPVVAAGDLNDVYGRLGRSTLEPAGFHSAAGDIKTFPAVLPVRPLDRVYFRGSLKVDHSFASHTRIARAASDHLPLVTEFIVEDHDSNSTV